MSTEKMLKQDLNYVYFIKIVFKGCFYMLLAPICRQKIALRGPEQSEKSDLRDQFQDTHFVVNPKCIKNPDWRE